MNNENTCACGQNLVVTEPIEMADEWQELLDFIKDGAEDSVVTYGPKLNKAAARRTRKLLSELKHRAHQMRKDITEIVNNAE